MFRLFRFLLLWLVIALAGCTPYVEYHRETSEPQPSATIAEGRTPVYRTGVLTYSPDGGSLDLVLERIESAKTRVWLATYILSEKRVMQALENAQARDVDVRVMLEPEVYNLPTINRAAFDRLSKKGIDVQWISAPTVGLHHAKYLIIDDGYILSTANFSHSSFTENREYFFAGNHPRDLESLERLFESDRTWRSYTESLGMITTSPETSRTDIEAVLRSAKVSVDLAMQSMSDPGIHQILADLAKQGIKIRMVLGGAGRIPENAVLARALESAGMEVGISDKPYIHAKVLIVDGLTVYLGSVNFTTPGFDENREVGILFENREIAQRISWLIQNDRNNAR